MRRHPVLEHLMHFLQRPISRLRQEEDGEEDEQAVGTEPDVAVFSAPAEFGGVDEVGCCEGAEPVADEVEGCCHAVGEGSELVTGNLAAYEPGCWGWGLLVQEAQLRRV